MKIYKFETLTSTNEYMKKNSDKFGNFDIVIAETQTEGKARR